MENVNAFDEWPIEELVHLEEMLTNVNSSWGDSWTIPADCRDAGTPNMADFYEAILGEIGSVLDSARIGLVTRELIGGHTVTHRDYDAMYGRRGHLSVAGSEEAQAS